MNSVLKHLRTDPSRLAGAVAAAGMVSIGACHTLLGIAIGWLLVKRDRFRMPPLWLPVALFFACTLLSLAVNGYWREGWPQVRKFYVWGIAIAVYSGIRTARQARWTLLAMAAGGTASAAWSLVQFVRKYRRAAELGEPFYQSYVGARITGFTSHWMTFASDMMMAIFIVAAFLLFVREARARRTMLIGIGMLGLLSLALLLSFTRSVWPATAAGLVVLLWFWRPVAVLSLPMLAGLVVAVAPEPLHSRIESLWRPDPHLDSNEHRAVLRRTGLAMAAANPLFGVGPERVYARFAEYYPADAPHPVPVEWYYKHLHNIYIHYAAERGIPAVAALLAFIGLAWARILGAFRRCAPDADDQRFVLAVAAATVPGILVGGWWEVNIGDSEVLGCFLSILACGFAAADARENSSY